MAKIVRNKPAPDLAADIAAFGAAAEAPALPQPQPSESAVAEPSTTPPRKAGPAAPKASLLRWEGNEDLRDAIIDYSKRERYSIQTILIDSIRRGFDQITDQ